MRSAGTSEVSLPADWGVLARWHGKAVGVAGEVATDAYMPEFEASTDRPVTDPVMCVTE